MLPFSLCTPCRQVAAATRKIGCSRQRIAPPCHAQLPLQHSPASALEPVSAQGGCQSMQHVLFKWRHNGRAHQR